MYFFGGITYIFGRNIFLGKKKIVFLDENQALAVTLYKEIVIFGGSYILRIFIFMYEIQSSK